MMYNAEHRHRSAVLFTGNRFRLRNDLYCVGRGVKLYSLTHRKQMDGRVDELRTRRRAPERGGGCDGAADDRWSAGSMTSP